jgi:hypothetical protein
MKTGKLIIFSVIAILAFAWAVAYVFPARSTGDTQRYAELHRLGSSYRRAWTGQPRFSERIAALVHLSSPSNYYRGRFEADKQALVASGYLVEVAVPIPDLRAKLAQVRVTLSNTLQQTGAYYEAKLDHTKDEVRLLCRKEDVSFWRGVLKDYQ